MRTPPVMRENRGQRAKGTTCQEGTTEPPSMIVPRVAEGSAAAFLGAGAWADAGASARPSTAMLNDRQRSPMWRVPAKAGPGAKPNATSGLMPSSTRKARFDGGGVGVGGGLGGEAGGVAADD